MSQDLQLFESPVFGTIEVLTLNGKEYFPATKVASILGYKNQHDAIIKHCIQEYPHLVKHGVGVQTGFKTDGTPAIQNIEVNFIDEGNLYRLIVKSKLPQAQQFERWVFDEVLPMIRRTGMYISDDVLFEFMDSPAMFNTLIDKYVDARNKLEEAKPKIETYDRIMNSDAAFPMGTAAKIMNFQAPQRKRKSIGRNQMFQILRELNILQHERPYHNIPFQDYVDNGYFKVITKDSNGDRVNATVWVTPRGIEFIMNLLRVNGYELRQDEPIPEKYNNLTLSEVI